VKTAGRAGRRTPSVTGVTIAFETAGEGPALVLLHSAVCDRRMWDPQWPAFTEAGHHVVRCDFRGYGDTPVADRPYCDAEDVRDLMDALGLDRATLIGSSYGGRVAVELAARWPDRVTAMALICAGLPGHERSAELRAFGEREDELIDAGDIAGAVELNVDTWLGPEASGQVRQQVREMQRHAFDVQLAATEEFPEIEVKIDLSAVRGPCLALSGAHDLPDFRQIAASLPGLFPGTRHTELPWAGHLPSLERPGEVTPLLLSFLAETALAD
jgi:3-oxoadipate enol-lactonase